MGPLGAILNLLGGKALDALVRGYEARLGAMTSERKLGVDLAKAELQAEMAARQDARRIIIAEQGRWWTALPRPAFALLVFIYVADQIFGWGITVPAEQINPVVLSWMGAVVAVYFGGRSIEKVASILSSRIKGPGL